MECRRRFYINMVLIETLDYYQWGSGIGVVFIGEDKSNNRDIFCQIPLFFTVRFGIFFKQIDTKGSFRLLNLVYINSEWRKIIIKVNLSFTLHILRYPQFLFVPI